MLVVALFAACWFGSLAITSLIWGVSIFEDSGSFGDIVFHFADFLIKAAAVVVVWFAVWLLPIFGLRKYFLGDEAKHQLEHERNLADSLRGKADPDGVACD